MCRVIILLELSEVPLLEPLAWSVRTQLAVRACCSVVGWRCRPQLGIAFRHIVNNLPGASNMTPLLEWWISIDSLGSSEPPCMEAWPPECRWGGGGQKRNRKNERDWTLIARLIFSASLFAQATRLRGAGGEGQEKRVLYWPLRLLRRRLARRKPYVYFNRQQRISQFWYYLIPGKSGLIFLSLRTWYSQFRVMRPITCRRTRSLLDFT